MTDKIYSIRKSHQILKQAFKAFQKRKSALSQDQLTEYEKQLRLLDQAIVDNQKEQASLLAHQVESFYQLYFKKTILGYILEMMIAILIALVVATAIRQTWFELYEIPTGSMRPTFKEQDHLTVTKTAFALNIPLMTQHLLFDREDVQRLSVITWSGEGVPHLDSESTFMGIFPYTKRYIKRCMGKAGDTLYFYGGKIYGFNDKGEDLKELRDNPWMEKLETIPFTSFDGRRSFSDTQGLQKAPEFIFHHFNQAIGRLRFKPRGFQGEIFNGKEWIEDNPEAQKKPHKTIQTYSDFWGMRNFAIARLLNKSQLETLTPYSGKDFDEALLYLELRHTPSLNYPNPLVSDRYGVSIKGYTTVIPLQEMHLKRLMQNMYTCRFTVKGGKAAAYRLGEEKQTTHRPSFPGVPDGTYEFYYGQAFKIGFGAIASLLEPTHPLYRSSPEDVQRLFNLGIEMSTLLEPQSRQQLFFPNRYVYFREGDLYAMGGLLMDKEDPLLQKFNRQEKQKEASSGLKEPYVAFRDFGPPLKADGTLDHSFIATFGYKVPEGRYLMLGDNHAMSQDSRYFGPIPSNNLQGAPSLIIWPPGDRWGVPNQKPYPLWTYPRIIVWAMAASIACFWFFWQRRSLKRSIFRKEDGK